MKMRKGFTLIELLIVLAIIAALMAVVTPIALNAVKKAKATQVAENMRNIKSAVESYVSVEHEVPTELASLTGSGYLNNQPDGFALHAYNYDFTDTGDPATVVIVYENSDVLPQSIVDIYSEAKVFKASSETELGIPDGIFTNDTAGVAVTIYRWWWFVNFPKIFDIL